MAFHQTIIVGAGPAGLGVALSLIRAGQPKPLIIEAGSVGASFKRWPVEMRLITPSFNSNSFFQTDLNAITPDTSPADLFRKQHLSGHEYAQYLQAVVTYHNLNIAEGEKVLQLEPRLEGFELRTNRRVLRARTVIWAGGEYRHPAATPFPGATLCRHNSTVTAWGDLKGDEAVIVGGYESGIDAACQLALAGKRVTVLSRSEPWKDDSPDPSDSLSPRTMERLVEVLRMPETHLKLRGNAAVSSVSKDESGFRVSLENGETLKCATPPILATGFRSALHPIRKLFDWVDGIPQFTEEDGSTLHVGLFYCGSSLIQRGSKFCFIYKFRARFGVVASAIARLLGDNVADLSDDRRRGFLVDDLECCTDCECALGQNMEPAVLEPEVVS